jgi:hypothetical protein
LVGVEETTLTFFKHKRKGLENNWNCFRQKWAKMRVCAKEIKKEITGEFPWNNTQDGEWEMSMKITGRRAKLKEAKGKEVGREKEDEKKIHNMDFTARFNFAFLLKWINPNKTEKEEKKQEMKHKRWRGRSMSKSKSMERRAKKKVQK